FLLQRQGRRRVIEQNQLFDLTSREQLQRDPLAEKSATTGDDDTHSSALDAVALCPAEPGSRLALGPILAPNPPRIAQFVKEIEEERVVDLADIGLITAGIAGDLHMRVVAGENADAVGEVALHE